MTSISVGFESDPQNIALAAILPSHKVPVGLLSSRKYKQISASIREIGLIEPLSVGPADSTNGQHLLLDGHIRLVALKDLGHESVLCLIAKDDEAYTYNNRINRISTIQEHFMLRRAIERGVPPERLAAALCVDVSHITKKANLLEGICPEAAELMKDKHFSVELGRVIRKMKPTRQVECLELMVAANNFSIAYAEALLVVTPAASLVGEVKPKKLGGVTPEQMARMEREMESLQGQYRLVETSYGRDVLNLTLAKGYLKKLLENGKVTRYLQQLHPEILEQFTDIVGATSLDQ